VACCTASTSASSPAPCPILEATASHAWQLSSQQLGFVVAAVLLGSVLSSLFAGMVADLIGRRGAMLLAGLLFTASIPIMALASATRRCCWAACCRASVAA
jgi:MFS family permease